MNRAERDEDLDALEPGRSAKLGKYQLLAVLGRGGMADVFLALSRGPMGFSKLVVVKRLRASLADDRTFRDMFLDEARLAARLNHPNVVHTHEVGENEGAFFIAMEYLEGQSLNKIIRALSKRGETLPPAMCARIVSDALAGLHYAHELKDFDGTPLKIIHRDVSPHNVFVTYDGSVKLVDFGIAKAALSSVETEVGVLKGKVAYMAPEQAAGEAIDARADVFAMGIVLWELLAQQRLMTGDSAAATLHKLLTGPIPKVSTERPDVGPELERIIVKALEKDANARFASALEMRDALEDYIAHTGKPVRQEEIGSRLGELFAGVREAIQKQIQTHMEGITQIPLHDDAPRPSGGSMPAQSTASRLPVLGVGGGSGSGIVAGFSSPGGDSAMVPKPAPAAAAEGKRGAALWLLLAGLVGVVALVAFTVGRSNAPPPPAPAAEGVTEFRAPGATTAAAPSPPAVAPPPPAVAAPIAPVAPVAPVVATSAPAAGTTTPPGPEVAGTAAPAGSKKVPAGAKGGAQPSKHPASGTTGGATAAPPAAPSDEGGEGYLTFDTYPWTQVSEGGKSLGTTPLVHVALPPGTHTLTLENADQGIKQSYTVTVKPGETVSRRLGLK